MCVSVTICHVRFCLYHFDEGVRHTLKYLSTHTHSKRIEKIVLRKLSIMHEWAEHKDRVDLIKIHTQVLFVINFHNSDVTIMMMCSWKCLCMKLSTFERRNWFKNYFSLFIQALTHFGFLLFLLAAKRPPTAFKFNRETAFNKPQNY
jgi:hypothetical protein